MTIETKITQTTLEDAIITALEGGSNYWYQLNTDEFKKDLPSPERCLSERIGEALYNNPDFKLNVYDLESEDEDNPELLGTVTQASCVKAFQLMAEKHSDAFGNLMSENYDANDADIFFQLATMGEVTFG
jgi:hypothetical protein